MSSSHDHPFKIGPLNVLGSARSTPCRSWGPHQPTKFHLLMTARSKVGDLIDFLRISVQSGCALSRLRSQSFHPVRTSNLLWARFGTFPSDPVITRKAGPSLTRPSNLNFTRVPFESGRNHWFYDDPTTSRLSSIITHRQI